MFPVIAAMAIVVLLSLAVAFFVAFPSRDRRLPGRAGKVGDAFGTAVSSLPTLREGDEFRSHVKLPQRDRTAA